MRKSKLKTVSLAVCGLMALVASSAQANWTENGSEVDPSKEVKVGAHTQIVLDVPVDSLEIECKVVEGSGVFIEEKSTEGSGALLFTKCNTYKSGVLQALCKPKEPVTAKGKGKLVLNSGGTKNEVLITPFAGTPLALVLFPETCSLPLDNKIIGTLMAECGTASLVEADCKTEEKIHLFELDTGATKDGLKYGTGEKAAVVLGSVKAELPSKNSWGGHV